MTQPEPTSEDLEKVKIVRGDALPHEFRMLEAATLRMEKNNGFPDLDRFTRNATVETFWTHARCLIEIFTQTANKGFRQSSASAKDFSDGYYRSEEVVKLRSTISKKITNK